MEKPSFLLLLLLNYLCCCGFSQELDESSYSDYLPKYSGGENFMLGTDGSSKVEGEAKVIEPDIEASIYEEERKLEDALEEAGTEATDVEGPEDSYPELQNPPDLAPDFSSPRFAPENSLPEVSPEFSLSDNPPEDNPSWIAPADSFPGGAPEHSPPESDIEPEYIHPGAAGEDNSPVDAPDDSYPEVATDITLTDSDEGSDDSSPEVATDITLTDSDEGSDGSPQEPCNYEDLNSLADLLIRHVRTLVPDTVYLPDQKKGPFYFRLFSFEGVSHFARRSYPAVACSDNSLTLVVPLHWETPLVGYFELGFSRFKTPIILTLERLEAEAVLELKFIDNTPYKIDVKSIRFTRSYDVKVRAKNFGFLRSVPEKMGAWLATFFETRIHNFLSRKFQEIVDKEMTKAVIGGENYQR